MSVRANEPIVDVDDLLRNVDGDAELLDELAATFAAEAPGWITALRASIAGGDAQATCRVAHGLRGAVGYLRAGALQEIAGALESMGREARLDGAAETLGRLEAGLAELSAFVSLRPWRR